MERKISQNQILIKVCCVIASFILWLYIFNVENPVRERKIVVPVEVVNKSALEQSNLVQVDNKNFNVSIYIRGNASDVFSVKAEDFKVICDLSSYVMKKGQNNVPVKVVKSPSNVSIVNSENLWVSLDLQGLVKKKFPIKLFIEGKTKDGFHAVNPTSDIKQAEVYGAANEVYIVSRVVARYNIKNISKDTIVKVNLQAEDSSGNVIKTLDIKPKYVKVNIPVKNIKSVPINIRTEGKIRDGLSIRSIVSSPDKVSISGDSGVISKLNSLDIEPVDLGSISESQNITAKLIVPDKVTLVGNNGYVTLKMDVEKSGDVRGMSQKSFNPSIQVKNLNSEYTAELESNVASVVVSGNSNVLNSLNKDSIQCFVDLGLKSEGQYSVNVDVNLPEEVTLLSQNPQNIIVNIDKKTSEDKDGN